MAGKTTTPGAGAAPVVEEEGSLDLSSIDCRGERAVGTANSPCSSVLGASIDRSVDDAEGDNAIDLSFFIEKPGKPAPDKGRLPCCDLVGESGGGSAAEATPGISMLG